VPDERRRDRGRTTREITSSKLLLPHYDVNVTGIAPGALAGAGHGRRIALPKSIADNPASDRNAGTAQPAITVGLAEKADDDDFVTGAVTVGVIMVGAALIEVTLIPGMIVGAAAVLAPKYLPRIGAGLQPLVKYAIRGAYKFGQKTREVVAEAQEHMNDIVAEVNAEQERAVTTAKV
jgi:Protein of unknown function (DUF5132)